MLNLDITELPGADNLLAPRGAIAASQDLHAQYIDAGAVYYTTGGSTAGVLAMLSLFRGRKVIFPRGIHLNAANAVFMYGITPVYLDLTPCDYPAVVTPEQIHAALRTHKDAAGGIYRLSELFRAVLQYRRNRRDRPQGWSAAAC